MGKKEKLKKIFLESPIFSITSIVKSILEYAENSKEELIISGVEALTARPN